jgi:hypothetical protein
MEKNAFMLQAYLLHYPVCTLVGSMDWLYIYLSFSTMLCQTERKGDNYF